MGHDPENLKEYSHVLKVITTQVFIHLVFYKLSFKHCCLLLCTASCMAFLKSCSTSRGRVSVVSTTLSPTDDDSSDSEDDKSVPSEEALDVILGDVLHLLLGLQRAQVDALPDLLDPAPRGRVLPVTLGHGCCWCCSLLAGLVHPSQFRTRGPHWREYKHRQESHMLP